ncbi:hypothetical protein IC229_30930 [Spirosoma sp. BT702]|uniref:NHL repeat-containing protein n=1 Tax=Spirosoma profusum TaxID=2771354 RepID=A0A927G9X9_9BACT|nr:hypothetical protein [Spirosoma profusum]MBD2705081.1 hypothetical protein [Spirosoma profusum]
MLGSIGEFTTCICSRLGRRNTGTGGYNGDGGPATSTQLNSPGGLAFDVNGNLYIADTNNQRIRLVSNCVSMSAVKTGSWNDRSVWTCGRLPVAMEVVTVNHVVSLPTSYQGLAK